MTFFSFKLLVISAPMVYKAFFCGIFYQIFQFKYLHMKLPSKEEWFLHFFTKQYWAFLLLKVSLNIPANHAMVLLGHKLPNLISTNQLRKKGAVLQEVLRKLKLLTDLKTDPTFRITWGTYIKKWQTSTFGQNRTIVIRFTLSPKTGTQKTLR